MVRNFMIGQAIQGMPRGYGRVGIRAENVSERSYALSKRYLEKKSCMHLAKAENQVLIPVLRNCEQRCIVLSFLTLDVHSCKLLVPFSSFNQQSLLKNDLGSEDPINLGSLDLSLPQPAIFNQFDLQKEQIISLSQNTVFSPVKTVTNCRCSSIAGQPERIKRNKFVKNSLSNSLTSSAALKDCVFSDGFDVIASDISASTSNQVGKTSKQSSRKKGKKKGKQCRKSMPKPKKASIKEETLGDEVNQDALSSEISTVGDPAYSAAHTSEKEFSPNVACPSLEVEGSDVVMDKLNTVSNAEEYFCRSSRSLQPFNKNRMDDSRKVVSLPHELTDEGIDKMSVNNFDASSSTQLPKLSLSISLQNNPESDMAADSPDIYETRPSITNNGDFNTSPNVVILTSGNVSVESDCKEPHLQDNQASSSCSVNNTHWQRDVGDTDCSTERTLCSSQASSSDDFHPVICAKRSRFARKFAGSSLNGMHRPSNNIYLHGRTEIDTKHSIWQRVEKNSEVQLISPKNNKNLATLHSTAVQTHIRPKKISELKPNRSEISCRYSSSGERDSHASQSDTSIASSDDVNSGYFSYGAIIGRSTYRQLEKLKRKPGLPTERESHNSVIASRIRKKNIIRPPNVEVQEMEMETIAKFETNNMQQDPTVENVCRISHNTSSITPEIQLSSQIIASNSGHSFADVQHQTNENSSKYVSDDSLLCTRNEDEQCTGLKEASVCAESCGIDNIEEPALRKWVPIGRSDLMSNGNQMDNQADSVRNELVSNDFNSSFTDECFSCSTVELQCSTPSSGYMDCFSSEEHDLTSKHESQPFLSSEGCTGVPFPSGFHLLHEAEDQPCPGFDTDLNKIMDAVDKSCNFLFASDGFHLATGSPLAKFERVLHSASPVLCDSDCISYCNTCFCGQFNGYGLCSHQIPSISLGKFWQWYEKPGSYGLEVKIDQFHTSNGSSSGFSEVRAFFVPYLSAVQLFSRPGKTACGTSNDAERDLLKTFEVHRTSKSSSCLGSLPIFSKLLPQSCKVDDTISETLSLSGKCEDSVKQISSEQITNEDLLYEYFESDQPQQRRPLFDKINQLVYGDLSSNCDFSGDPSKLECLNLKDIHPASWYAVAWYPIYRIPDGSFRAAFLTYHSFGSFVRRSTSYCNGGRINSVVSPVVGLQSYNAKGECWFEPTRLNSSAVQSNEALSSYSSDTLMGRIQSLEQAAHVMSRAKVRKGDLKSVNRHPDYEFFLSRRR